MIYWSVYRGVVLCAPHRWGLWCCNFKRHRYVARRRGMFSPLLLQGNLFGARSPTILEARWFGVSNLAGGMWCMQTNCTHLRWTQRILVACLSWSAELDCTLHPSWVWCKREGEKKFSTCQGPIWTKRTKFNLSRGPRLPKREAVEVCLRMKDTARGLLVTAHQHCGFFDVTAGYLCTSRRIGTPGFAYVGGPHHMLGLTVKMGSICIKLSSIWLGQWCRLSECGTKQWRHPSLPKSGLLARSIKKLPRERLGCDKILSVKILFGFVVYMSEAPVVML